MLRLLLITLSVAVQSSEPATAPPASAGHNLIYADHVGMVVLLNAGLGGMSSPPASTPTRVWGWTGSGWKLLDSSGPPLRNLAGVTYDTKRQTLIMHGGSYDLAHMYGETWEWSAKGWQQVKVTGPGTRDHTQMAFDRKRGRAVLFGGGGADPNVILGDTWEFDGKTWTRAATTGPAGRVHHTMHYDPVSERVVMFGGAAPGSGTLGDTWSWDGTGWTREDATTPRSHARMTFHRGLNALLIFGGMPDTPGPIALVRRERAWHPLSLSGEPGQRYLADVAYDERRNVMVLFGGGTDTSVLGDTWEFDGKVWQKK